MPKQASSTARSAVRLCSSMTGLTSTISKLTMRPVVGNDLHGQVGFAVGGAAADGGADSGGILGVDPVHIERDMVAAGGAAAGGAQCLLHHRSHAALVDVAHGVDLCDPGTADIFALGGVDVADADENRVFRSDFWRKNRRCCPAARGPGPAVRPAACRGRCPTARFRGVLMSEWASIQSTPTFWPRRRLELGHTGNRADRQGVVAAEDKGDYAVFQSLKHGFGGAGYRSR